MFLDNMRKGVAKVVGSILAALLIVAMAAWGIEDFLRPNQGTENLAAVGGTDITAHEFDREFRNALNRLRQTLGPSLDIKRAQQFGIVQGTLEGLVDRRLMTLATDGLGIRIGDDVVRQQIARDRSFHNGAGQFDPVIYRQVLSQTGMSEGQYVALLRGQLQRSYVTRAVSTGGVAPKALSQKLFLYQEQKRTAEVVTIPRDSVGDVGKPSESQLVEYHKKNAARFTSPEYRKVSVIVLDPAEFAAGQKPSEEAIKTEYETRLDRITVPERRKLQQILLSDEKKAQKAASLLSEGRSFSSVAQEIAGKKPAELSIGLLTKKELSAISSGLADKVFAINQGETTKAEKTGLGWHIVHVEEVKPGKTPTLADVRAAIIKELALEKAVDQLSDVANKVEDALGGGGTMEEAASKAGATLQVFQSIDRQGRAPSGKTATKLPGGSKFLPNAFETAENEVGQMQETEDGGFFILRVDKVIAPAIKPLASVRADVVKAWTRSRQNAAAAKRAREVLDKVKSGTSLASTAEKTGLKHTTIKDVTRRGDKGGTFPTALIEDLFRLKPDGGAMGPSPEGYAVVQLKSVTNPELGSQATQMKEFRARLTQSVGEDLLLQFSQALRARYPVTIHEGALKRYIEAQTSPNRYGQGG